MKYTKYWIPFPFVDIYFIVWKPNAISKIHNHSKNGCYMVILKGDIKEEIYNKKLNIIGSNYYSTFDISYINDDIGYHRIKNTNQYSYSLHFYHPRNHITTYFD
tara:strand:+ start:8742 stop:9053 length:312 start_codon:yes stop_codon:yes gene_type:complete